MRLNGWQRIGIVASVIWAFGAPIYMDSTAEGDADERFSRSYNSCRLHGGLSPGAPRGEKNGNFKTGDWTLEAIEERKWLRSLLQSFCKGSK
jgi:hypothetical protein